MNSQQSLCKSSHPIRVLPRAQMIDYAHYAANTTGAVLLLDCQRIRDQYHQLQAALPGVKLYYAIKALPHLSVITTLRDLGAGFDLASSGEVDLLKQAHVFPRSCIHTHPIKTDAELRAALRMGCTTFVVDNMAELEKLIPYRHRVGVLLRVSFRHRQAVIDLSKKFGCDLADLPMLLTRAQAVGLHVKGLSFHVGSQCADASKHVEAINACAQFMQQAKYSHAATMHILDIGGGFPVSYSHGKAQDIHPFCQPIREALAQLPADISVIAEPGRVLCAPAMTSIATIIGRAKRAGQMWYYLNDGIYGSFSGQLFDHVTYPLTVFSDVADQLGAGTYMQSTLAGPTCDSIDVIAEDVSLPELNIGDLVVADMMGAYTWATRTNFNSLPAATIQVINECSDNIGYSVGN